MINSGSTHLANFKRKLEAKTFEFNPENINHIKAYISLESGKQHPDFRFYLNEVSEEGKPVFETVLDMMRYNISQHHCKKIIKG